MTGGVKTGMDKRGGQQQDCSWVRLLLCLLSHEYMSARPEVPLPLCCCRAAGVCAWLPLTCCCSTAAAPAARTGPTVHRKAHTRCPEGSRSRQPPAPVELQGEGRSTGELTERTGQCIQHVAPAQCVLSNRAWLPCHAHAASTQSHPELRTSVSSGKPSAPSASPVSAVGVEAATRMSS